MKKVISIRCPSAPIICPGAPRLPRLFPLTRNNASFNVMETLEEEPLSSSDSELDPLADEWDQALWFGDPEMLPQPHIYQDSYIFYDEARGA